MISLITCHHTCESNDGTIINELGKPMPYSLRHQQGNWWSCMKQFFSNQAWYILWVIFSITNVDYFIKSGTFELSHYASFYLQFLMNLPYNPHSVTLSKNLSGIKKYCFIIIFWSFNPRFLYCTTFWAKDFSSSSRSLLI